MATAVQTEHAIALPSTTTTPGASNDEIEDSNTHADDNGEISMVTGIGGGGGSGQNSMDDSSRKFLLVDSTEKEFDFLWKLRKYLVLLGILAVGVTYNSGLTPPGGFWNKTQDGHEAGDPALRVEFYQRYEVFFYCNATAFAASLVLIILLLSKSVTRQKLWLRSMQFTMLVDLFSLMGAYASGSCRALESSMYTWVLVIIFFAYVFIHILVSTRFVPETFKNKVATMVNRTLSKLGICDEEPSTHQEKTDLEEARKFILMLVTFAATVTYQAGLNPPGGFWAENDYISGFSPPYKHRPATPVLRSHYLHRHNIFVSCNSTSFVASLVTIILLLSPELSSHGIRSKAVLVCVVADLLCLIGAYAAGCCRDVATSFYVMFITVIVLICIGSLAGIFVYKPDWLEKIRKHIKQCMGVMGRALSLKSRSNRSINAKPESSHGREDSASVAPAEDNACEPELETTGNQQVSNTTEVKSSAEYPPEGNQKTENTESFSYSQHPSDNSGQSMNTKDLVSNLECEPTNCNLVTDTAGYLSSTEHAASSCLQRDGISDNQLVSGVKKQSSAVNMSATDMTEEGSSQQNMLAGDSIEDGRLSLPVEASGNNESAEEHTPIGYTNHDIENGGVNNAGHEDGHIDCSEEALDQNYHGTSTEEHLEKTRTYLLLLAILAVSLTYQSGLNPPGGFWTRNENRHSAGDRILEDSDHPRFIAFFYLNAVAFVASIVIILMALNKSMSKKVTKHRVLQIVMIVDLLSLTGAFVLGTCRDAKKSITISVLLCLVLAYVALHVLIAIHVIPSECKSQISDKLKNFSCGNVWSLPQLCDKPTGEITSPKELERRRNLLLTLAILAATVTYQAGTNPPGGVWSDDKDVRGTPGNPILQDNHRRRYDVFYYSNSVSFVSSVAITILLVNKESCENGIKSYALRVCLVVGLLGLLIAYAAGSCRNRKQSIFVIAIAVAVLTSLVIQVLLSSMYETLRRPLAKLMEYLQQLVECLQSWVFRDEMVRQEITSESPETKDCDEQKERKRHKYLMLIATLAASIAYQAGLNPPGGFWSDDDGHFAGDPLLLDINHRRYKTFFCFNAISFMASIVVIMLLLSKSIRKKAVPLVVLLLIMILDLLSLMTAFAAGSCRKLSTSVYVFVLVAGVVIYLVVLIVLSRAIKKYPRKWKTVGLSCSRNTVRVSSTNTRVQREQA